jgi:hypothetical protein
MSFFKKEKTNFFKFITPENPLSFNEVHHNFDEMKNIKDPLHNDKLYFLYDKQSDRFIYIFDSNIYIFSSKGTLEKHIKVELFEKAKLAAVEYNCNFLLLLTKSNQGIISDLSNNISENYNIFDKGDFLGGFFIKRNENKTDKLCKLCMVSNKNFIISKIYTEQNERGGRVFKRKNFFTSKEMRIYNYYYSSESKVIIIRIEFYDFLVINLKNKVCYEQWIKLNNLNTKEIVQTSMFMVRNIYHKLYFIHMNSTFIEFYEIKDLKRKKEPKIIKFESEVNQQNIKLQFTNNLIFVFNEKNIYIYDIKSKKNKKISELNYQKNKDYQNFYKTIKIYGDYIEIGKKFYKTTLSPDKFYENNRLNELINEQEMFLIILRREGSRNIIKKILIEALENVRVDNIYTLINILISKNVKNNIITQDKKNPFQILLNPTKNYFFLNSDEVFALFSRNIKGINPIRTIQLMGILYKLYENSNIPSENDIFVSTLFYQLNNVKNFSFLESGFKNKLIPKNNKLGWYLIDKATHIKNEIKDWEKIFDLGIENLLEKEEGLGQAVDELIENQKYYDCYELIIDYFTQENLKKNDNSGNNKGTIDYFKQLVSGQKNKKENDNQEQIVDDENNDE